MKYISIFIYILPIFAVAQTNKCQLTKETFYNNEKIDYQAINQYNTSGLLSVKTENFGEHLNGPYSTEKKFTYDTKGNNTQIEFYHDNKLISTINKVYDINNVLIEETTTTKTQGFVGEKTSISSSTNQKVYLDKNGGISSKTVETFNAEGKLIKKEMVNGLGKVTLSVENTYSAKGELLKTISSDNISKIITTTSFSYDKDGNVLKEVYLLNNTPNGYLENTYNATGKLAKKVLYNKKSVIDYQYLYEYTAAGLLSKESYIYDNQTINTDVFEYDTNGNKTKLSSFNSKNELVKYKTWEYICK